MTLEKKLTEIDTEIAKAEAEIKHHKREVTTLKSFISKKKAEKERKISDEYEEDLNYNDKLIELIINSEENKHYGHIKKGEHISKECFDTEQWMGQRKGRSRGLLRRKFKIINMVTSGESIYDIAEKEGVPVHSIKKKIEDVVGEIVRWERMKRWKRERRTQRLRETKELLYKE